MTDQPAKKADMTSALMRFSAFIFDLDGVLVDSYDCWREMINDVLRNRGKAPMSREDFDKTWGQGPEADREMFFPNWSLQQVLDFYNENFHLYTRFMKKEPGADRFLQGLKEKGKLIGVASNSTTPVIEGLLKEANLLRFVDRITGAEEVEHAKPAPDLIFAALRKLRVGISDACYFGDSIFDEQAAEAAGIFFISFKRPSRNTISDFFVFAE